MAGKPQNKQTITGKAVEIYQPGQAPATEPSEPQAMAPALGHVPPLVISLGSKGAERFTTFFTDDIRNVNTRNAYFRAAWQFFTWCDAQELGFDDVKSYHVSAYIEEVMQEHSKSKAKQHLAAIRKLFDWLIIGQVVEFNPAHAVRGPKHVVSEGLTPILDAEQMSRLLGAIDTSHVVGLRDRALIGLMTATFARIEAAVSMNVDDYYPDGKQWSVKLREKNGKVIVQPVHHRLEEFLDAYIEAAGGVEAFTAEWGKNGKPTKRRPLFRTARGRSRTLTGQRMTRIDGWRMIRRRAEAAGITTPIGNHTFRGTGVTNFLENGGKLEDAQYMAGHSSAKTTKLYDRRQQLITRGEVERISVLG